MKKILLSGGLLISIIMTSQAQIIQKTKQTPVKIVKTQPVEPKTTPPSSTPASVYSLSSVRVNIRTGDDNKEFPSGVYVELWVKNHQGADYAKDCLFKVHNLKNEMRVNSNSEFGLEKYESAPEKFTLETLQKTGLVLSVGYNPNFFLDAWKIEGITLTLEFKDQNGNPHPTMGTKTITFNNAYGVLNGDYRHMNCTTDQSLNSITASIE